MGEDLPEPTHSGTPSVHFTKLVFRELEVSFLFVKIGHARERACGQNRYIIVNSNNAALFGGRSVISTPYTRGDVPKLREDALIRQFLFSTLFSTLGNPDLPG
jgi:hypothetical protein